MVKAMTIAVLFFFLTCCALAATMTIASVDGLAVKPRSDGFLAVDITNNSGVPIEALNLVWDYKLPGILRRLNSVDFLNDYDGKVVLPPGKTVSVRPPGLKPEDVDASAAVNFRIDGVLFSGGRVIGPDVTGVGRGAALRKKTRRDIALHFLQTPAGRSRDSWIADLKSKNPQGNPHDAGSGFWQAQYSRQEAAIYQSLLVHGEKEAHDYANARVK